MLFFEGSSNPLHSDKPLVQKTYFYRQLFWIYTELTLPRIQFHK